MTVQMSCTIYQTWTPAIVHIVSVVVPLPQPRQHLTSMRHRRHPSVANLVAVTGVRWVVTQTPAQASVAAMVVAAVEVAPWSATRAVSAAMVVIRPRAGVVPCCPQMIFPT